MTTHTEIALADIEHPPTPRDMRWVVLALLNDDELDRATQVSERVTAHGSVSYDDAMWWLGIEASCRAIIAGRKARAADRRHRAFVRSMDKHDRKMAALGCSASAARVAEREQKRGRR